MENRRFDECMERIRSGDKDALKDIYTEYAGYIFHMISGIVGNRENAEDITSEFFIRLWDKADRYQPGNGHKTWITQIARNMAIDYLRAHNREIPYDHTQGYHEAGESQDVEAQTAATGTEYVKDISEEVTERLTVEQVLSQLKPEQREIVHLKVMGDLTFKEIAKMLGIPMGTVTWRYRQAIKTLRRCGYEA